MIRYIMIDLFGIRHEKDLSPCQAYWYIRKHMNNDWTIKIIEGMITMEPLFKEPLDDGVQSPQCSFIGHYGQCIIKLIEMALNDEYQNEQESLRAIWEEKIKGVWA